MLFFGSESGSASFACDAEVVYDILTAYDDYDQWMPLVASSKLLAQEGDDLAIAELEVDIGDRETLAIECIHDRNRMVLSRGIGGSLPVSKIEWNIKSEGPGRCTVSLTMHPENRWETFLPSHRRFLDPDACIASLRRYSTLYDGDAPPAEGDSVFRLFETPDGLTALYMGKRYKLTPISEESQ
ncbi:MAG: SRPBCC family protein [Bryobacteraceae bacterium]